MIRNLIDIAEEFNRIKATSASANNDANVTGENDAGDNWTPEELAVLIKAVNKFPGGTRKRWETIAAYVSQHAGSAIRKNEELINKTKHVQQGLTCFN